MNLEPDQQIDRFIYFWRCWEPNESWVIQRLLRPNDIFVDVGANDGYFSLLASKLVGRSGQVVALEPVPTTAAELRANIALNGFTNISVVERAASDTSDHLVLMIPCTEWAGMATLRTVDGTSCRVKCDRLDSLLADFPMPQLVKMDIEGAELKALRGLERVLVRGNGPHILCEVTASFLTELGYSVRELYSWMEDLGYQAHLVKAYRLQALPKGTLQKNDQENVLFTKRVGEILKLLES